MDAPSISMLNDFCLEHIFSHIPLLDRFELEAVCKQWKRVLRIMWQRLKQLDLPNGVPVTFSKAQRNLPLLKQIFRRAPLKSLNIQGNQLQGHNGLIETIVRKCPEIEELHFFKVRVDGAKLHMLAHLKNLKSLVLIDCEPIKDNALKFALQNNRTLTRLELSISRGLRGQCLRFIHAPLETLNLYGHPKLNPLCLEKGLQNFGSTLKHLGVSRCDQMHSDDLEDFLKYTPNLQSLTIAGYKIWGWCVRDLFCIAKWKNLESLDVSFNDNINDKFFQFLVEECQQLKSLNLSGIENEDFTVYDEMYHISCLNVLQNLRSLNLSCLHDVKPKEIQTYAMKCPPIEYLYLAGHPYVEDKDIEIILTSCKQLKHLDLSNCDKITPNTLKAANDAVGSRTNGQPLHLVVGCTRIKKPGQNKNSDRAETEAPNHPLLSVSYENRYLMHRRQFFIGQNNYLFDVATEDEDSDEGDDGTPVLDLLVSFGDYLIKNRLEDEEDDEWSESSWTGTESEDEFFK